MSCLLNSFGNYVHRKRFGFHPYVYELASLVRQGYLERSTTLAKLEEEESTEFVDRIRISLGLNE